MKKVIRANSNRDLRSQLDMELADGFEANIINKYSKFINYEKYGKSQQKAMFDKFNDLHDDYIDALANVIQFVDVDEFA